MRARKLVAALLIGTSVTSAWLYYSGEMQGSVPDGVLTDVFIYGLALLGLGTSAGLIHQAKSGHDTPGGALLVGGLYMMLIGGAGAAFFTKAAQSQAFADEWVASENTFSLVIYAVMGCISAASGVAMAFSALRKMYAQRGKNN